MVNLILETYQREKRFDEKHYFIVIAHSQGNFFGEGVAYRLFSDMERDRATANFLFNHRLGILSLASPTIYDSIPQWFRSTRIKHFVRQDDAIVALRVLGGRAKRPWSAESDLPALWTWAPGHLQEALQIGAHGMTSPLLKTITLVPPPDCGCPPPDDALYIPLMSSHLMENYLADPALTEPGREIGDEAAQIVGLRQSVSPETEPVLVSIRLGLYQLKQLLMREQVDCCSLTSRQRAACAGGKTGGTISSSGVTRP